MEALVIPAVQALNFSYDDVAVNHMVHSSNYMLDLIDPWNANLKLYWKAKIHRGSESLFD